MGKVIIQNNFVQSCFVPTEFITPSRFVLFLVVCLFMHSISQAQESIRGKVFDADSRDPLEGVTVRPLTSNTTVVTDKLGNFTINRNKDIDRLYLSCIGYHSKEFSIGENDNIIFLSRTQINLEEVIITNSLNDNYSHTVSKMDLHLRPARSSQDILRFVPGLFIAQHSGGGKAEQIFLRGFDADHGTDVQVSVDGIPVNMVSHAHGQGYADLHFLIPELLDKVDYGKGPYYADKGNFNTSGYVDMNTAKSIEKNRVQVEGGQFNNFRALGMLSLFPKSDMKQNAYIASEYLYFNGPFTSPQKLKRFNVYGKYNAKIGKKTGLTFFASAFGSNWNASGQVPERAVSSGLIGRYGAIDNTEGGATHRYNMSVSTTTSFRNGNLFEGQLYYSKYDFRLFSNFTFYLNDHVNGDQIRQVDRRNLAGSNFKYIINRSTGETLFKTTLGLNLRADQTNNTELSQTRNRSISLGWIKLGDITERNMGIYIEEKIGHKRWLITAGSRLDYIHFKYQDKLTAVQNPSQGKTIISPKLSLSYTFNPDVQLYLKAGKGFHSNDTRVVVTNAGKEILPPAYGSDFGIILRPATKLLFNAAVWYLYLGQEFVYVGDAGIVEPSGQTRRVGVDLLARYQLTRFLFADMNFNWAHGRFIKSPKEEAHIPLSPKITSTGGLTYKKSTGLNGSLHYRFLKDRPANENNTVTAKGYFITDANVNYTYHNFEVGVIIENVFNAKWNEAQFDTKSRLRHETNPVSELHFTPGIPFFAKLKAAMFF